MSRAKPYDNTPLTPEVAKEKFAALKSTVFFEKVLTSSDTSGTGRIVIPKAVAEGNFPEIESQNGINLVLLDTTNKKHVFRFRYWVNNASRMYLIEGTQDLQQRYNLGVGDVLMFGKDEKKTLHVAGRKGTKDDVARKPPKRSSDSAGKKAKRAASAAGEASASGEQSTSIAKGKASGSGAPKTKRSKEEVFQPQKEYTYWAGLSLPPKVDGVFRAMPAEVPAKFAEVPAANRSPLPDEAPKPKGSASAEDKVTTQLGHWTAIVTLGGEKFQAFFTSREAANAAFEAARQNGNAESS